jgi:hypothetical protein
MEAFIDVVAYKKNDELIRVWYRFGEVAGVMVPGVPNNDKVITAVINTLSGEDTWKNVTKASSASNIYDSKYNLYHATGSEIAAWVSRGANSMVLVGESDFVKDFDTAWAKMLHKKKFGSK